MFLRSRSLHQVQEVAQPVVDNGIHRVAFDSSVEQQKLTGRDDGAFDIDLPFQDAAKGLVERLQVEPANFLCHFAPGAQGHDDSDLAVLARPRAKRDQRIVSASCR